MSKTYEYIPTLSITPDTQEHRMSAARFIPAILGRRKLIAYYAVESRKEEGLCKADPLVRQLTTAQKQAGMTLEQVDAGVEVKHGLPLMRAEHLVCRSFSLGKGGVDVNFLAEVYIEMMTALSSANSVPNDLEFKNRARIWLQRLPGEANFKLELSTLKFESDAHHLQGVSDTLRNSEVKAFTAYGKMRSEAEQKEWEERSQRAAAAYDARSQLLANGYGTLTVTDASEQEILRVLSKKSEIADKITQPSWSKRVPENMSNVIVSLALKKTSDEPLKVGVLKKRRVDDFDNTIEKSLKFLGTPDTPEFKTVTGRLSDSPVGFRIYNKNQELVAFHDHRIRDNVPNANGLWFPVAGFKRDPEISEVTPENTPRWTNEAKLAALNTMYGGQTAAQRSALLNSAILKDHQGKPLTCTEAMQARSGITRYGEIFKSDVEDQIAAAIKQGHYVSERGVKFSNAVLEAMRQAAGEEPILKNVAPPLEDSVTKESMDRRAFDAEGYYNL